MTRIASRLARDDWADIDLVLEQFGFETASLWEEDKRTSILHSLKRGDDDGLVELDEYLLGHSRPDEERWENESFRLFLTHVAEKREVAHSLKSSLRFYGVDAFVAHDDIQPAQEWLLAIEEALHSCDALAGLLHEGFRESDWCDQEVGIAIGRRIVVVPIQFDLLPYGFFGSLQAVNNAASQRPTTLARSLVRILLEDKRSSAELTAAIVAQLARAETYPQANKLAQILAEEAPPLSRAQLERLRRAKRKNYVVRRANAVEGHLSSIEAKSGVTRRLDAEVEPF